MIMKHKWLVLLLCVAMLLTFVVAGCATKPDDEAPTKSTTTTATDAKGNTYVNVTEPGGTVKTEAEKTPVTSLIPTTNAAGTSFVTVTNASGDTVTNASGEAETSIVTTTTTTTTTGESTTTTTTTGTTKKTDVQLPFVPF